MNPNRPRNAGTCCEPDLMPSESQSRGDGRSCDRRRCCPPLGDFNASIVAATLSSSTEEDKPIEDAFIVWFVIRWRGLRCCSDSLISCDTFYTTTTSYSFFERPVVRARACVFATELARFFEEQQRVDMWICGYSKGAQTLVYI